LSFDFVTTISPRPTRHDLEMLNEIGFCKGIENYPASAICVTPSVIH